MSAAILPFRGITNPHAPRARCSRCNGRRVIDIGILEPHFVPCPSCHHNEPKGAAMRHVEDLQVAA